ncbi:MAG: sigma-54-dependent Fis family transcriptional regulator, partial [Myxococcales bacterium]
MTDAPTLPETALSPAHDASPWGLALVVIWTPHEPHLLGACLLPTASGASVFGRGDSPPETGQPRLLLRQQRPGDAVALPSTNARLSRAQLRVSPGPDSLVLDNLGLCPLLWRGQEVRRAEVSAGDVVALGQQMALLCVRRPRLLPGGTAEASFAFGEADEHGLVGESPAAWTLRGEAAFLARRGEHVLVQGPSGSGKEILASALHALSSRRERTLVSRNAATIPEALVDAELFGNARNYPNPGMAERPGLIGQAHQSTLFLDEFAELPESVQAHLLRVLDAGDYQRLGDASVRRSDFRLIAATNRPLSALKEDVAARFLLRLRLPGLDDRREDVPLLARHLLRRIGARDREAVQRFFPGGDVRGEPRVSRDLAMSLVLHPYATHVRELLALLWDSVRQSPGDELTPLPDLSPWSSP